jgi:hypothetical protein
MANQLVLYIPKSAGGIHKRRRRTTKRKTGDRVSRSGSFKRHCKRKGFGGATRACIRSTLKHGTKKRRNQAKWTRNLHKARR